MAQISVIIPLYNGEAFIQPCLLSAARQTHRDLEILVIDDGSTDRGPDICRELGRDDDRIKLYCQENGGVSAARNRGLELAAEEKDKEKALEIMEEMLAGAEEISSMQQAPLYAHMTFKEAREEFLTEMKENLKKGFREDECFAFLKEEPRYKKCWNDSDLLEILDVFFTILCYTCPIFAWRPGRIKRALTQYMQCAIRSCKTEDCVPLTSGPKTFSRRKRAPAQALQTGGQAG